MAAVDRQPPVRTLAAKIVRPVVPPSFLERPTLTARVDEALSRGLTTVVAGPGFGKSTLLSAWATARGYAWYSVTGDDVSVGALARGLAHGLRSQLPGLLGTLHSAIEHLQDPLTAAAALEQAHA